MAFTMVELLVVVAMIGALTALAFPTIQRSLVAGKQTASASNMRQIGAALMMYANDHNQQLPETSHTAFFGESWIYTLEPYLDKVDKVRICPADPKGPERLESKGTSYVMNSYLFVPEFDAQGQSLGGIGNDLRKIKSRSNTIMTFVISDLTDVSDFEDHTHSSSWTTWSAVTRDIAPDRFTTAKKPDHSVGSSNYLYADGHVEVHLASTMKARLEAGDNFALPR
jgi:prepilin-type processing-associated H-X9-DG protein